MKIKTISGAIVGLLAMGLVSCIFFPPGQPRYRLTERLHAKAEFRRVSSEDNKKAVIEEYTRLRKHQLFKGVISFILSLTLYVLFVRNLWKKEKKVART